MSKTKLDQAADKAVELMQKDPNLKQGDAIHKVMDEMKIPDKNFFSINGMVRHRKPKPNGEQVKEKEKTLTTSTEGDSGEGKPPVTPPPPEKKLPPIKPDDTTPYQQVFAELESGGNPIDVMTEFNLTPTQLESVLDHWNSIKAKWWEKDALEARYMPVWHKFAQDMGVPMRDGCPNFDDATGICKLWKFQDIPTNLRRQFPGIFKVDGSNVRVKVSEHPEICSLCHRGIAYQTGAVA